jgi:hypothetical protein
MMIAALLAGLYGIGTRRSAVEAAEVAVVQSPAATRETSTG